MLFSFFGYCVVMDILEEVFFFAYMSVFSFFGNSLHSGSYLKELPNQ